MKNILSKGQLSILIVLGILILDQVIKIEVKTNMFYNESIHITDWFYLRFIENPGMAFGMQIVPKAIQTIARTIFAIAIGWYIVILIKAKYKRGYIACISLILAGAIGNIIDSIFYGVIFSKSTPTEISTFVPIGEGYTGWLHGKVVDMFYFPLFQWNSCPGFLRFLVDSNNYFFGAIFNLADVYISLAAVYLLVFQYKFISK